MTLLIFILISIPVSILAILIWIYSDFKKYKRQNNLIILLFFLFPTTLCAQYVDNDCRVSFKWYENQKGKLEYSKNEILYKFIPSSTHWEIIIRNTSSKDAQINWKNVQFIANGRASEITLAPSETEDSLLSTIKSNSEVSRTITITTSMGKNKTSQKIYDSKSIRKGNKAAVTIILPISIGKQPNFSNKQTDHDHSRYQRTVKQSTFLAYCIDTTQERTENKKNIGAARTDYPSSPYSREKTLGRPYKRNTHPGRSEMCIRICFARRDEYSAKPSSYSSAGGTLNRPYAKAGTKYFASK